MTDDIETAARAAGWKPLEEWKGDASKHIPADRYMLKVAAPRRELEELRERVSSMETAHSDRIARLSRAAETAIERATGTRIDTIRAAKEQAITNGDVKAYRDLERVEDEERVSASKALQETRVAPATPEQLPETAAWRRANDWFDNDVVLRGAALAAYNDAQRRYPHFKETDLLAEVDKAVGPMLRVVRGDEPDSRQARGAPDSRQARGGMPDLEGGGSSRHVDGGAGGKRYDLPSDELADCRAAYNSFRSKRPELFKDFDDYMTSYLGE